MAYMPPIAYRYDGTGMMELAHPVLTRHELNGMLHYILTEPSA